MYSKPKIFVSSTIMDFDDIRGALKYHLKELGFEVQMSEYPNFNVDKDKSSFDACLENIKSCRYFVLLIGYRRGAWYIPDKISITHKEYLKARELIESGHPIRIIAFVRKSILLLKNDRELLLKNFSDYSSAESKGLLAHSNSIVDDPAYIYNFINEISKGINLPSEKEPVNNWIFQFNEFEDIIVALKNSLNISGSLIEKRRSRLLIDELKVCQDQFLIIKPTEENKKRIVAKQLNEIEKDNVYLLLKNVCYSKFVVDGQITNMAKELTVSGEEANRILMYSYMYPLMKVSKSKIEISALENATTEGMYLSYNVTKGEYEESLLSFALKRLYGNLSSLKEFFKSEMYLNFEKEILTISTDGTLKKEFVTFSARSACAIFILCLYDKVPILIQAILNAIELNDQKALLAYNFTEE
jgi:hypothetical protein